MPHHPPSVTSRGTRRLYHQTLTWNHAAWCGWPLAGNHQRHPTIVATPEACPTACPIRSNPQEPEMARLAFGLDQPAIVTPRAEVEAPVDWDPAEEEVQEGIGIDNSHGRAATDTRAATPPRIPCARRADSDARRPPRRQACEDCDIVTLHALLNALTVLAAMRWQSCQPWWSHRQTREPLTQRRTQTPVTLPHCCAYPTRILAALTRVLRRPLAWPATHVSRLSSSPSRVSSRCRRVLGTETMFGLSFDS